MAVAALVVSVASALAAASSSFLAWWVHNQQGALLRCKSENMVELPTGAAPEQFLRVRAVNAGRSPTRIDEVGVEIRPYKGRKGRLRAIRLSSSVLSSPCEIIGDSSAEWKIPWEPVLNVKIDVQDGPSENISLFAYIRTGADRMVYSKKPTPREPMVR